MLRCLKSILLAGLIPPAGLILILLAPNFYISAAEFSPAQICPSFVNNIDEQCKKLGVQECRSVLEKCEAYYKSRSDDYAAEISKIKNKEKNLENEIWTLTKKIEKLDYEIYKNNLIIKDLNFQIDDTQKSIIETNGKIEDVKTKLAAILQLRYEEDQRSFLEILLAEQSLSDFYDNLVGLDVLNKETQKLLEDIKGLNSSLKEHESSMVSEKEELERTQILGNVQKDENQSLKFQKKDLLTKTKGEEVLYQSYLKETEQKAEQIRKKIFELAQVAEGEALTLEQAYNLAKEVERLTGVRPALLLGLLKVESDIGSNVGQCNCAGAAFCRHPEIHWKQVMSERQWPYFEEITKELGRDTDTTSVSCSVNDGKVQWGGAMGPAQFMPETWLSYGYKRRVEDITGIRPANPWRVKDAFVAAGLYLADFGAASQAEIKEIGAARAYLCGTTQLTLTCRIAGGSSYVYNIMKYASQYQAYIDQGVLK